MKLLLIIIILIFSINTTIAQLQGQAKIDSLLKELPKAKKDTNKVNLIYNLSYGMYEVDTDLGIKYSKLGIKLSQKNNWKLLEAKFYMTLGNNYSIGKSDYYNGLYNFQKALDICLELKDSVFYSYILNSIGMIYYFQMDYKKASHYYNKSLEVSLNINDSSRITKSYLELARYYVKINKNNIALDYCKKALENNQFKENKVSAILYFLMGDAYKNKKEYKKSLNSFLKSIKLGNELGFKFLVAANTSEIGELYLNQYIDELSPKEEIKINELHLKYSIDYLKKALDLTKELKELEFRSKTLKNISHAYALDNDTNKAFVYHLEYVKIRDSIFNRTSVNKITSLEKSREADLKKQQIEAKENEKLLIMYFAISIIVIMFIVLFVISRLLKHSEKLLLNVLPANIAKRLKAKEHPIADHFDEASIMFIDLVEFTKMSSSANPKEIVALLNDIFTIFDKLADKHGLEKIKTIGDAYMAVAGIPEIQTDHAKRTAQMALDIKQEMKDFKTNDGTEIKFRIGIDCGAVVAGVIGEKKFIYDLWSDAVNTASRMESTGESGQIQITDNFKEELEKFEGNWNFTFRGEFEIKGKGLMKTYYLGN